MGGMSRTSHARARTGMIVATVVATGAVLAPSALASPSSDLTAMANDYKVDRDITDCRFTKQQLTDSRALLTEDINSYNPDFRAEIDREIARWRNGGCAPKVAGTTGKAKTTPSAGGYTVSSGLTASCPKGGAKCSFSLSGTARARREGKLRTITVVARKSFTLAAGRSRKITFKLNKTGAALLRKNGKLKVKVTLVTKRGSSSARRVSSITLRKPK